MGSATITGNEIRNCAQGISIDTSSPFTIIGNLVLQNNYGIKVSNNYWTSGTCFLEGNEITQNNCGLILYNSNTKIAHNFIHHNNSGGLYLVRGSEPVVKDNSISYSESSGSSRPEITLWSDSYPIIDDARNDFNTDGVGYSLYYASPGRILPLNARNNYWGSNDSGRIRSSIYPLSWDVQYEPFSLEPNNYFPPLGDNLFNQALAAEESGDLLLAKQLYTTVVTNDPDSLYALQSLGRLNSLYAESDSMVNDLRYIYSTFTDACSDSLLVQGAGIKLIMLDRFDRMYQDAVNAYTDLLDNSTTELDSLLCLMDIAYTLQEMYYNDDGKGTPAGMSYHANGLSISSLKEAKHAIETLWDKLITYSDNAIVDNAPVPTKIEISNYPNPFNPSTTIAFSLLDEGIVRLSVYNIRGQKVKDLINSNMIRGFHKAIWDGRDNSNRYVSSGLYFVRLESANTSTVRKLMMLK